MKAVACLAFQEPDVRFEHSCDNFPLELISQQNKHLQNVIPTMVKVSNLCSPTDILVRVRAASIHRIDYRIANGYGRTLRRMIQKYNTYDHQELPLVLGRGCSGIVEGVFALSFAYLTI